MFLKIFKRWNSVRKGLIIVSSIIIIFLFGVFLFGQNRLSGDVASHLLLAIGPILKIGAPYKDLWETKPPVWPLILYLWSNIFGFSILSIRIINLIIAGFIVFICQPIYKKVFQTPVFEAISLFTIVVVLSPLLHSIQLPTELLGLLFSLWGLYALISFRKDFPKFYFSGLLFFAASQTKEPFTFTVLAMLPVFVQSLLQNGFVKFLKNLFQFLLGMGTCFTVIYIYLASLGSVGSYIDIFKDKAHYYPLKFETLANNFFPGFFAAERTFTEFSLGFFILLILAILSFYLVNKYKNILKFNSGKSRLTIKSLVITDPEKTIKYSVLFYSLGSFMGFGLQDNFSSHYLIQVVIPFYLINGFVFSYLFKNVSFLFNKSKPYFYLVLVLLGFSMIILMPKRQYFFSYRFKNLNFSMTDQIEDYEKRITELTTKDQCILSVYGWGVSENYLYSRRKPCTRFFLTHLVALDWQKKEFVNDITNNPPAVIVYTTLGADMDIKKFELGVLNISKIIKNCYVQDKIEKIIYIPKTKNIDSLKICVKDNSV